METSVIVAVVAFILVLAMLLCRGGTVGLYYKEAGFYLRLPPAHRGKRGGERW